MAEHKSNTLIPRVEIFFNLKYFKTIWICYIWGHLIACSVRFYVREFMIDELGLGLKIRRYFVKG